MDNKNLWLVIDDSSFISVKSRIEFIFKSRDRAEQYKSELEATSRHTYSVIEVEVFEN